jgi:3-hydroxy-9,10-secoandrosta-1,3,5(10)-triene-9,17-dione monooxygenase
VLEHRRPAATKRDRRGPEEPDEREDRRIGIVGHEVFERIEEASTVLADRSAAADELGRLPDDVAKRLQDIGVVRMLQPADFGGYEADPREFLAAVMEIGHSCPSAGWVAGVVGVHPWELALNDLRLQEEVWGSDPDTWVASPYAPCGTATPVDGGYTVEGRWPFSSGTDLCDWVVLGALVPGGGTGGVPFMVHVMLPRGDYEIDPESWKVMGLGGTGSKDVIVRGAFVPAYRAIDVTKVMDGRAAVEAGRTQALYRMPWSTIFPSSVAAGLLGIAEGVLEHALEYQAGRVNAVGVAQVSDPHSRRTLGEAAADLRGARTQLLYDVGELYEGVADGYQVTMADRVAIRRDQVRVAWRAVEAADRVFTCCGGNAVRLDKPVQRFWRAMHAGMNHAVFVPGPVYDDAAGMLMGEAPSGPASVTF